VKPESSSPRLQELVPVLRRIFEMKMGGGGVTGEWRKLHAKELHNFVLLAKLYSDYKMKGA
jgi:hypothetical protein